MPLNDTFTHLVTHFAPLNTLLQEKTGLKLKGFSFSNNDLALF